MSGSTQALEAGFQELRLRFLGVAARRVPAGDVEDLVQEALRVVLEKRDAVGAEGDIDGLPPLAWCFQVLRNTIGNYYQRQRTRRDADHARLERQASPAGDPTPLEALEARDELALITDGFEELRQLNPPCARYLEQMLDGVRPADIARDERISQAVLYRRIYRCRERLRGLLRDRGVTA